FRRVVFRSVVDACEAGKARGENLQTQAANCVPNGMPGIMRLPYPLEFVYSPGRVNILIETYSQVRRIYVDGRALPEDPDPFFNGHSVGRWEGDTLVVDTVGISPMVSILPGLHATPTTRFQERITRVAPDRLVDEITITDPALFAEPYVMVQNYTLQPDWEMREYVCQENNRDGADEQGRPSMDLGDPFAGLNDSRSRARMSRANVVSLWSRSPMMTIRSPGSAICTILSPPASRLAMCAAEPPASWIKRMFRSLPSE